MGQRGLRVPVQDLREGEVSSGRGSRTDPEVRAAKRKARREAMARGSIINPRQKGISASQAAHGSSGRSRKKAREGEKAVDRDRNA